MKGLKALSDKTQNTRNTDRSTWIPLYYSISKDTVYNKPVPNAYFVTDLINPNTPDDIKKAVQRFLSM